MNSIRLLASLSALLFASAHLGAQDDSPPADEAATRAAAQAEFQAFVDGLPWVTDGAGDLEEWATIEIPRGYRYLNGLDADKLMQAYGNLPSKYDGMIAAHDLDWFVLFQFDPTGYVKDDEKDELDADKLLAQMKENQTASNRYRAERGLEPMYLDGWAMEPRYNERTNNLEWGLLLRSGNSPQFVNYETKLLGREGVMEVTLVCDLEDMETILPSYQNLLLGHAYKEGKSYAEYRQGDKIAEYGLTALIAGGALYGAAKLGLLGSIMAFGKKFIKIIVIGLVAIGAAAKKFFSRLSGREVRDDS